MMRIFLMFLCCLRIAVSTKHSNMTLRYHSHPSLAKYNMMDFCGEHIQLSSEGRNSGLILDLNIPLKDINSEYLCSTALMAPKNYHILISMKKIRIYSGVNSCSDYIMILNGGLNSTNTLAKICGYYNEIYMFPRTYRSKFNSSTLTVKVYKEARTDDRNEFSLTLTATAFSTRQGDVCPGKDQMLCSNQNCVWEYFKCNGHNNCGDRSDEIGCGDDDTSAHKPNTNGNSKVYIAFLGVVMVLITMIMLLLVSRFKSQSCCCNSCNSAEATSRHRASTCEVSVISTDDHEISHPPPYVYDNDGYDTEPPPSYEEALSLHQSQYQNESYAVPIGRHALHVAQQASAPSLTSLGQRILE